MRQYTVKGLYRCDEGHHHGAPVVKPYSVTFMGPAAMTRGDIIKEAAKLVHKQDETFDSLKTHEILFQAAEPEKPKAPEIPEELPPVVNTLPPTEDADDIFGDATEES